jgi:hypothetical protein
MTPEPSASPHPVGTLNEGPLHAALKEWVARPGDQLEARVEGYTVDIVRGDLLIEIQTGNFSSIRDKLSALTERHPVRLVYPVAREKWIVKLAAGGQGRPSRRKSPKRGTVEEVFRQLVSFPNLLANPNFSLDVLLIQEEEIRHYDSTRAWRRRGWVTDERRLLDIVDRRLFETPADMAELLPSSLPQPFTTADLAACSGRPRWLAQKMAYCLREMGAIEVVGKEANAFLYIQPTS